MLRDVRTYFDVLEVPPTIDPAGLKKQYRSLVQRLHPDASGSTPEGVERLKVITAAYAALRTPEALEGYRAEVLTRAALHAATRTRVTDLFAHLPKLAGVVEGLVQGPRGLFVALAVQGPVASGPHALSLRGVRRIRVGGFEIGETFVTAWSVPEPLAGDTLRRDAENPPPVHRVITGEISCRFGVALPYHIRVGCGSSPPVPCRTARLPIFEAWPCEPPPVRAASSNAGVADLKAAERDRLRSIRMMAEARSAEGEGFLRRAWATLRMVIGR